MAGFLVLQYLRVPRHREEMDALADQMLKRDVAAGGPMRLREVLRDTGEEYDDEAVKRAWEDLRNFDWSIRMPREHHVIESLGMIDEFAPVLRDQYDWSVIRFERRRLMTSDHPLLLLPDQSSLGWRAVGLVNAGRIIFALSRQCALCLFNRRSGGVADGKRLPPSTKAAEAINQLTVLNAHRRVFHHPEDVPETLLGRGFRIPRPTSVGFDTPHSLRVRDALVKANEYAFNNPNMPHPLQGLPSIER
jgi:hypothetical protein